MCKCNLTSSNEIDVINVSLVLNKFMVKQQLQHTNITKCLL